MLLDCLSLLVSNLLLANKADPEPAVEVEVAALLPTVNNRSMAQARQRGRSEQSSAS